MLILEAMSNQKQSVRIGVVGLGNMGGTHARDIREGKIPRLELAAVSDVDAARAEKFPGVPSFPTPEAMIESGLLDAILIATPHYSHTPLGIAALKKGLHVLVEKPISVHKADAEKLIAAHTDKTRIFAAMFNQRTDPRYATLRQMIRDGSLGQIRRVQWTVTDWFRTNAYYASGGWRATWQGEGGGVLLNQCPHNLDLLFWLFGVPKSVRAFCRLGQYHDIEVEDDVTAYLEYPEGHTATFITSTGEAPGTNRLEIAAEKGRVVVEGNTVVFIENEVGMSEFSRTTTEGFARPKTTERLIPFDGNGRQHLGVMENFTEAILDGKPLLAPAEEGIHSVQLANAMLLSSHENRTVEFPLDGARYEALLLQRIAASPRSKK